MKLNRESWHYKVYSWWAGYQPSSANLCPYVRAVLIWAPLMLIGQLLLTLFRPFKYLGRLACELLCLVCGTVLTLLLGLMVVILILAPWSVLLTILVVFASAALILFGIAAVACWLEDRHDKKVRISKEPNPNTTWNLIKTYAKSWHDKVCPIIVFDDEFVSDCTFHCGTCEEGDDLGFMEDPSDSLSACRPDLITNPNEDH